MNDNAKTAATSAPEHRDDANPSWWQSTVTISVLFWAIRLISRLTLDPSLALKIQLSFIGVALLFGFVRVAVLRFGLVFIAGVILVHAMRHPDDVRRDGWPTVARVALRNALSTAANRALEFRLSSQRQPYLRAIHEVRDASTDVVLHLADQLTEGCGDGEYHCEIERIVQGVKSTVTYRSDPVGHHGDSVQPPMTTWQRRAGDCEDQAILLISLFRSHGIRAYAAFSPGHMFAVACDDSEYSVGSSRSAPCWVVDTTRNEPLRSIRTIREYGPLELYDSNGHDVLVER